MAIIKEVFFKCLACQDYNKHRRDLADFEVKQVLYNSFSEAFNHMMENRDHFMTVEYDEYEEQE